MTSLSSIAAKVRALLSKTTAAGASEAEAAAATSKARELMDRYQLDLGELGLREEGTAVMAQAGSRYGNYLAKAVAQYCACKTWVVGGQAAYQRGTAERRFIGLRSDVEFADWLLRHLTAYVQAETANYLLEASGTVTLADAESFATGALGALRARLLAASGGSPNALVVVKSKMVDEAFAGLGIRINGVRMPGLEATRAGAYIAGDTAGKAASFARPLAGRASAALFDGRSQQ